MMKKKRRWYVYQDNKRYGPFSESGLRKYVGMGRLKKTAMVWQKNLGGWKPITEVGPFKSHFEKPVVPLKRGRAIKELPKEPSPKELAVKERRKGKRTILVFGLTIVGMLCFVSVTGELWMDPTFSIFAILAMLLLITGVAISYSFRRVDTLLQLLEDKSIQLKETDEQLRKAHEELKSLDKLKTDFMNMAAHELRAPLTPIIGYLHLIDKSGLNRDDQDNLNTILQNAKRLERLVGDILDIAKLESKVMKFNMEEVQIADLIKNSVVNAKSLADEKGISLEAKNISKLPVIHADPMRLAQVLDNLINNAVKFTDEGGITIAAWSENSKVIVEITDTGVGIPEDDLPKLFTKFFQAKTPGGRRPGGTGLGLAICKEIIKALNGEIWVKSKVGEGSTFGFSLPIKGS
jgi:signal transduction histidine kinase